MPERPCANPVWPCAMCGAVSCLSGFSGIDVVIHGSSGCYFYPASLIQRPVHATMILEEEVIFGSEERLCQVVDEIRGRGKRVAVVLTCVPSVTGEDITAMLDDEGVIVIDSPGFAGGMEEGYRRAMAALGPAVGEGVDGITVDGLNPIDPFYRGNLLEAERMIRMAGGRVAAALAAGPVEGIKACGRVSVGTNPGLSAGVGRSVGYLLGLDPTKAAFSRLADLCGLDAGPVLQEAEEAGEQIDRACDKYLSRFDPPAVAIFAEDSYAAFAAATLRRYLDAEIAVLAPRTGEGAVTSLEEIEELIAEAGPDLILGSSYEQAVAPEIPFVGLTFPQRGRVRLHARPITGIEGSLAFIEDVLTACRSRRPSGE
ncbi:nitrogenase component 1 [Methanofollis tationis]|uniref:Oxidoreductase n=1 Tax=Methanofollis tationis TaxID=81417 RepID=A0A7K4HQR1_9EURY|nr:nitrogenase component 1 [Methanofollis tationis]NVO67615.1 oxidoreductase [Methanofollis tationis]